jgi:hypothetical protein
MANADTQSPDTPGAAGPLRDSACIGASMHNLTQRTFQFQSRLPKQSAILPTSAGTVGPPDSARPAAAHGFEIIVSFDHGFEIIVSSSTAFHPFRHVITPQQIPRSECFCIVQLGETPRWSSLATWQQFKVTAWISSESIIP